MTLIEPSWVHVGLGLRVLPLRSPTLPPATHTNTSFVGTKRIFVVDPAPPAQADRDTLVGAVTWLRQLGAVPTAVVLTHHHPDHCGAAAWLADACELPIWAHPGTQALVGSSLTVDRTLAEGTWLEGGPARSDRWLVLHTPGHASDHLVLWDPIGRRLVAGDMVAGVGTIVVAPPDGHMATYLDQLRRLKALGATHLVPAHGDVIDDPEAVLGFTLAHRLKREAKVLAGLRPEACSLSELTARAYDDVPRALHPLAARAALAHLIKLADDGRARRTGDGLWRRQITPDGTDVGLG